MVVYCSLQGLLSAYEINITLIYFNQNASATPYEPSTADSKFTPRAGLSYSFTTDFSGYFLYDRFFLQNSGTGADGKGFDPLNGDNIEFGLKKEWFGGRWNSVLAAYRIKKNNVLMTSDVPMEGGGFYSRQSGQANVKGIELDIQGEIAPGLGIVLNYAYTDAKISKDSDPTVVGNRLPGTARHIQNTWLNYRIPTGKLAGLKISAGYQYQVKRVAGLVYDKQEYPLADYFRLDAALGYSINRFDVNLNVNNLLDKYLYVGGKSGSYYWWQTEPGRNFRLGFGYRF